MNEYENLWKPRAQRHDEECHNQRLTNYMIDPSCPLCYPIRDVAMDSEMMQGFLLFWSWYQPTFHAATYTRNTINDFNNAILVKRDFYEENNRIGGGRENEIDRLATRVRVVVERLIGSIRYNRKPPLMIESIIVYVVDCVARMNDWELRRTNEEERQRQIENLRRESEEQINNQKFDRFWIWYMTIAPTYRYSDDTKEVFKQLTEWEAEIADARNAEINRLLRRLISSILYTQYTTLDIEELKTQIRERFIYSQNFRLDNDETELNRERILRHSSQENTPSDSSNTDREYSPIILSPDENENDTEESEKRTLT